jgi:hypothetical protein
MTASVVPCSVCGAHSLRALAVKSSPQIALAGSIAGTELITKMVQHYFQ